MGSHGRDQKPIPGRRGRPPAGPAAGWVVYLLRCADGSLYTGIARDPDRRVSQHNGGRGAAYTRARRPVTLVYHERAASRPAALRREWAIKRLTRMEKEALIMRGREQIPADQAGKRSGKSGGGERFSAFRPAAFRFFAGLRRSNTRPWFEANRSAYEAEVREPLKALVEELDVRFARFAPEITGDPRRSLFRIHRDVRFSRDKSPYKTHAACWFFHQDAGRGVGGETSGGAGFYFHFSDREAFLGGGIWMPPRDSLARIRDALAEDTEGFESIVLEQRFRRRYGALDQEAMLKRLPRGFAPEHPAARWLRYQSFTVGRELDRPVVLSARLPELLAREYEALTPLVRWLNRALGFRERSSRL